MKTLYILFIGLLVSGGILAQSCLPEGITFETQAQIDSFQINYPNCTEIEGNVAIIDELDAKGCDITNLDGLSVITSIGGGLDLGVVINIGPHGNVTFSNPYLTDLTGLSNLTALDSHLVILGNHDLPNLNGLDGITECRDITIKDNYSLNNLDGLDNLSVITGHLCLRHNSTLTTIEGLESLTYAGDLTIGYNELLQSLSPLNNLDSIGGKLEIIYTSLIDLSGLGNLTSLNNLEIYQNEFLISLSGIENINPGSLKGLKIYGNNSLSFCNVQSICDYLADPAGVIEIYNNASGCMNPPDIAESCGFTMPCLPYGNYIFLSQDEIDSFNIDYLGCTDLMGNVSIGKYWFDSTEITNLYGLSGLSSIEGDFFLIFNTQLKSCTGLEDLTSLGGGLLIVGQHYLRDLKGFNNLNEIGSDLSIRYNKRLADITSLENINPGLIKDLTIKYNDSLSHCAIQNICEYLISPGGEIDIHDNSPGCNSHAEVEEACGFGIVETTIQSACTVYPNPLTAEATYSISLQEPIKVNLVVIDRLGRVVATVLEQIMAHGTHSITWNAEGLPSGIYFYRLQAGDQTATGKMVVLR